MSKQYRLNKNGVISEHDEQSLLIEWSKLQVNKYPDLRFLFAIPNAGIILGKLKSETAFKILGYMRAEGLKPGVPDLFLPSARIGRVNEDGILTWYHGLFIEMKSMKGKPQSNQSEWMDDLSSQGYKCLICKGFQEARDEIVKYLDTDKQNNTQI